MQIILRITLAATLALSLSSCGLIGAAVRTAQQLLPLLLLADENSQDKNNPEAVKARARQIDGIPAYDGRMDWIKNDKAAPQGLASR